MAEGTDTDTAPQQLKLDKGHSLGHTSVSWFKSESTWQTVTAGGDSRLVARHARNSQEIKSLENHQGALNCISVSPDYSMVAGVEDQHVKAWRLPDLTPTRSAIGRLIGTPRCCCWDKDSTAVAAAGDDSAIQIITVKDARVKERIKNEGFTRGLALDPEGQYLAAANADGTVSVWDIKQQPAQQELRKRLGAQIDHDDDVARQGLAWHPDGGTLLAVAGPDNDVLLLERLSWTPVSYLTGGHTGNVGVIAFSPNGVYAATAGTDNKIVVWLVDKAVQIASRQLSCIPTSLSWHPQNNALLVGGSDGGVGIWTGPVPELGAGGHKMPSPWLPVDDLLKEQDREATDAKPASYEDIDLEDDMDDDDLAQVKRRGTEGGPTTSGGNGPSSSDLLDQLDAAVEEAAAYTAGRGHISSRPVPSVAGYSAARPKPPQDPIHPGSTPESSSSSNARFLAYNKLGCVVSKAVDDHHTVEVSFHDTSRHRLRVPLLTDFFNFTAASMSGKGVAYISKAVGAEQPSMLVWRPFESWSSNADWTAAMPGGEDALVVAAGHSFVAVCTSARMLRIYTTAGRQLAVLNLSGQPVAITAADPGHALDGDMLEAACQQHLAVVWAEGGPNPQCGTQQLAYAVYDVARCSELHKGKLVLSPGASLSWLAFSQEGLLATMDSQKVLRLRTPEWGGSWMPVLDASGAKERAGAEQYWPTWLDTSNLMAVVTNSKAPYPQISPRPLITSIPLGVSTAPAEAAPADLEEASLRSGLKASQLKMIANSAGLQGAEEEFSASIESANVEADKTTLRLLTAHLKSSRQARALELVTRLHQLKSIEGALKIANHFHMPQLAERITAFLEDKIEYEQQQEQLHQQQVLVTRGGCQMSQEEVENMQPTHGNTDISISKPHHTDAMVNKPSAAAGQKRKTPSITSEPSLGGQPKANPFARKKVVK